MRRWEVLSRLAKRHGWRRMAEIGVFAGRTSRHLLETLPALELILVDHWQAGDPSRDLPEKAKKRPGDHGYRSYASHPLGEYRRKVEAMAAKYPGRATVLAMPSLEAAGLVEDGSLDAVFLDGDHTTEAVMADIRAWAPKIRTGGLMTGHDIDMASVAEAVDRMVAGGRITCHSDSVWSVPVEEFR